MQFPAGFAQYGVTDGDRLLGGFFWRGGGIGNRSTGFFRGNRCYRWWRYQRRFLPEFEVDLVLGDQEIAIEVKSTELAHSNHLKGLRRFKEEYSVRRAILISLDSKPRKTADQIEILPWKIFLEQLWGGRIL